MESYEKTNFYILALWVFLSCHFCFVYYEAIDFKDLHS